MCFAPQRRALFRHLNFQKWSERRTEVFCTFSLRNVLRATTACTFSTSQLPKVVRHWGVLYILTSKCASRHNGVHFFDISTSKSGPTLSCVLYILTSKCASRHNGVHFFDIATSKRGPRPRCFVPFHFEMCFAPQRRAIFHLSSGFSEPTFRPSGATNHWKNTVFRDFPTFSRICIFFLLTLSLLLFSLLIFLYLSASALLCFSSVHIVGSLTSKLPSTNPGLTGREEVLHTGLHAIEILVSQGSSAKVWPKETLTCRSGGKPSNQSRLQPVSRSVHLVQWVYFTQRQKLVCVWNTYGSLYTIIHS